MCFPLPQSSSICQLRTYGHTQTTAFNMLSHASGFALFMSSVAVVLLYDNEWYHNTFQLQIILKVCILQLNWYTATCCVLFLVNSYTIGVRLKWRGQECGEQKCHFSAHLRMESEGYNIHRQGHLHQLQGTTDSNWI